MVGGKRVQRRPVASRNDRDGGRPQALVFSSAQKSASTFGQKHGVRPDAGGPFHPGAAEGEEAGPFASSRRAKACASNLFRSHWPATDAGADRVVCPAIREGLPLSRGISRRSTPGQPALRGTLGAALARRGALR